MGLISPGGYAGLSAPASAVYDADTQAFISAAGLEAQVTAGIITRSQVKALDVFVVGLKSASLWVLIDCLYPFIGGTAFCHKFNLRNPTLYQVAWNAATHSAAGVTLGISGNNTGFTLPNNSPYYGTYIVGGANLSGSDFYTNFYPRENFYSCFNSTTYSDLGDYTGGRLSTSIESNVPRYAATTRIGGVSHIFANSSSVASASTSTTVKSNLPVQLSAGAGDTANGRQTALCVIAQALTPAQHSTLYTQIQTYQTSMGRAV